MLRIVFFIATIVGSWNIRIHGLWAMVIVLAISSDVLSSICTRQDQVSLYFKGSQNMQTLGNTESLKVNVGSKFFLICCHPDGGNRLKWTHVETGQHFLPNIRTQNEGVQVIIDEKERLVLIVSSASDRESGEYVCSMSIGSAKSQRVYINVGQINSKVTIRSNVQMFRENSEAILKCPTRPGEKVAAWMYYKEEENFHIKSVSDRLPDSVSLGDPDSLNSLKLVKAKEVPNKVFCWVTSMKLSPQESVVSIEIFWGFYRPPHPVITTVKKNAYFIEGQPGELKCEYSSVTGSHSQTCRILLNGMPIPTSFTATQNTWSCSIHTTKFEQNDLGNYTCVISTEFRKKIASLIVNDTISYRPDLVLIPRIINPQLMSYNASLKQAISLTCRIVGNYLNIQMRRSALSVSGGWEIILKGTNADGNSLQFKPTNNGMDVIYNIPRVRVNDMRKYQCAVSNPAGEALEQGDLLVRYPVQIYSLPEEVIFYMMPVTIVCLAKGYPLTLKKDNVKLVPGNSGQKIVPLEKGFVDKFLGINRTYSIQLESRFGSSQIATCVYSENNVEVVSKKITFNASKAPKNPDVSVFCVTHSSIIFLVKFQPGESEEDRIVSQYISIEMKGSASQKSVEHTSKTIVFNQKQAKSSSFKIALEKLQSNTNYSLEWISGNKFSKFNSKLFDVKTKPISKPLGIESMTVSIDKESTDIVFVDVTLKSECPNLNLNVVDLVLRWMYTDDPTESIHEKVFLIKREMDSEKFIRFSITVRDRSRSIKIEAATRNQFGTSPWYKKAFLLRSTNMGLRSVNNPSNCVSYTSFSPLLLFGIVLVNMSRLCSHVFSF